MNIFLKTNQLKLSLAGLSLLGLAACGAKVDGPSGNVDAYQEDSSYCSQGFVNEYNSLKSKMSLVKTADDLRNVRSDFVAFQKKYAGVNCEAKDLSTGKVRNYDVDSEIKQTLEAIDKVLESTSAQVSKPKPEANILPKVEPKKVSLRKGYAEDDYTCSQEILKDIRNLAELSGYVSKPENYTVTNMIHVRTSFVSFQIVYPQVHCKIPNSTDFFDVDKSAADMIKFLTDGIGDNYVHTPRLASQNVSEIIILSDDGAEASLELPDLSPMEVL